MFFCTFKKSKYSNVSVFCFVFCIGLISMTVIIRKAKGSRMAGRVVLVSHS